MSVETIRPDGTAFSSGSPSITGAASVHAAWNDDSDGSFVEFNATSDIVRVTFESPTIPAGALVSRVVVRARVWNVGSGNGPLRVAVGTPSGDDIWSIASTPTTVGEITIPQSVWPVSDLVTGLEVEIRTNQSAADVVIYELYADVYYVDQPTLTVDEPTGTVTDTNAPEVTWSGTLDSEGGAQTKAQVKVFDDATYGAGGFDPDSSTPTSTSGELAQATESWTVDDTLLADDTYRAYVRIAQTVNGTTLWSDWAFSGFDIDVDLPGVPTLTLTADSANARIQIDLTDNAGVVSTDGFEVQRSLDGGVTWDSLRTELGDGLVATDDTTVYDYEAPNGTTVHYRARSRHDYGTLIASSAWASDSDSWSSTSWWLKHPNQPALNTAVVIRSFPKVDRAGRQGVFQGLGASFPVVVSDTRESKRGTVVLRSFSIDAQDALDAMLDTADTLLLQSPAGEGGPDYIQVLNHERARVIDQSDASRVFESLEFVQVDEALSIETSSGTLTTGGGFVSTFGTRLTAAEDAIAELDENSSHRKLYAKDALPPYADVKGDGSTDDTAALEARLAYVGAGGTVVLSRGLAYVVSDLEFQAEGQILEGDAVGLDSGVLAGAILRAGSGATYVAKSQGLRYGTVRNVAVDGDGRSARGLLFEATASATSQSSVFDQVWFYRCTVGLHIGPGAGGITQADKNTLYNPQFIECDVGIWNESTNGQETILHNANFSSTYDTSIKMSGGTLLMIGGQFQGGTGTKGIDITGPGVDWINLKDVIFEGPTTDIDGSAYWPRDGILAENTVFQGTTANLKIGVANARFAARACRFNDSGVGGGQITVTATGVILRLEQCDYAVPIIDGAQAAVTKVYMPTFYRTDSGVPKPDPAVASEQVTDETLSVSGLSTTRTRLGNTAALNGVTAAGMCLGSALDVQLWRDTQTTPTLRMNVGLTFGTYTEATKPAAANVRAGTVIYVSDGAVGSRLQLQHGGAWIGIG